MKTLIASIAIISSVNAFAVSNCKNLVGEEPYAGKITSEARELSYNNCPESVLVNDRFVADLYMVKTVDGKDTCGYKFGAVTFLCENK